MKTERGSYIITVKKEMVSLQTLSCGNNLPFQQKVIFNIFSTFCVRNLSPISPSDTDDFHRAAGETVL